MGERSTTAWVATSYSQALLEAGQAFVDVNSSTGVSVRGVLRDRFFSNMFAAPTRFSATLEEMPLGTFHVPGNASRRLTDERIRDRMCTLG